MGQRLQLLQAEVLDDQDDQYPVARGLGLDIANVIGVDRDKLTEDQHAELGAMIIEFLMNANILKRPQ